MSQADKYEAKIAKIESIIQNIETGKMPLEEVFKQYEIAGKLLKECELFLEQGKENMKLVIEELEQEELDF